MVIRSNVTQTNRKMHTFSRSSFLNTASAWLPVAWNGQNVGGKGAASLNSKFESRVTLYALRPHAIAEVAIACRPRDPPRPIVGCLSFVINGCWRFTWQLTQDRQNSTIFEALPCFTVRGLKPNLNCLSRQQSVEEQFERNRRVVIFIRNTYAIWTQHWSPWVAVAL